jgi:virginiamycin B lyase
MPKLRTLLVVIVVAAAEWTGIACTSLDSPNDVAPAVDSGSDATVDAPDEGATRDARVEAASADGATLPDGALGCSPDGAPIITEFTITSTAGAGPTGIVLGPDGNIWFALDSAYGSTSAGTGDALGRMSPDGSSQASFTLPTSGSGPSELVVGPDGNIWFTELTAGQVGHIATDGTGAVEYPLSDAGSQPNGIAVGPDGKIWFTDLGTNSVGWIPVTGGAATEIPLPESDSLPAGILAGPDGNLWFTEQRGNRIAKIATTPGATPTEYTIPTLVNPHGLTFGPDGNVWYTEYGANDIGRMTLDGGFDEFTNGMHSWRIVVGPDGNLWFTEGDDVGRVTLTGAVSGWGTVTAWQLPTASANANCIAVGPDGTLWFTEQATDKIGRVTLCK